MRFALLAIALSLAACGDPANNSSGMDGGAQVDTGVDEARAEALCRQDVLRATLVRDWPAGENPPGCAAAIRAICTPEQRAACPQSDPACCYRSEHCGAVSYVHCR